MTTGQIVFAVVGVLLLLVLVNAIKIVPEYQRGVIFRLGRIIGAKGPGLFFIIPIIDRMVRVDLRTQTVDIPPQDVITADNVTVRVNAVTYFNVVDPNRSVVAIEDYRFATFQVAQTTLRSILGQTTRDDLLMKRDDINVRLQTIIDEVTNPWGVKVSLVEVKDVNLPESMQRAVGRQAEAERERRAKIIHALGEGEAAQNLGEAALVLEQHPAAMQLRTLASMVDIVGGGCAAERGGGGLEQAQHLHRDREDHGGVAVAGRGTDPHAAARRGAATRPDRLRDLARRRRNRSPRKAPPRRPGTGRLMSAEEGASVSTAQLCRSRVAVSFLALEDIAAPVSSTSLRLLAMDNRSCSCTARTVRPCSRRRGRDDSPRLVDRLVLTGSTTTPGRRYRAGEHRRTDAGAAERPRRGAPRAHRRVLRGEFLLEGRHVDDVLMARDLTGAASRRRARPAPIVQPFTSSTSPATA